MITLGDLVELNFSSSSFLDHQCIGLVIGLEETTVATIMWLAKGKVIFLRAHAELLIKVNKEAETV